MIFSFLLERSYASFIEIFLNSLLFKSILTAFENSRIIDNIKCPVRAQGFDVSDILMAETILF